MWSKNKLWALRQQITLGSLYFKDYRNELGVEEHTCFNFFDGYLDYLEELMKEDGIPDDQAWDYLKYYNTREELWNWYGCFEEDPLPITMEV